MYLEITTIKRWLSIATGYGHFIRLIGGMHLLAMLAVSPGAPPRRSVHPGEWIAAPQRPKFAARNTPEGHYVTCSFWEWFPLFLPDGVQHR